MKALGAILFSVFFLLTTMQEVTFLFLYKLNEKAITEKYCVNKAKPKNNCHGKCHLTKTIAKAESENDKNPFSVLNLKVKEIEIVFQQLINTCIIITTGTEVNNFSSIDNTHLSNGIHQSLIKPPIVLG